MLRESTDMAMDVEFQLSKAESLSALRLYYIQFLRRRDGDATMRAKAIVGLQQIFAYRQPEGDVAEGALEDIRQIVSTALHEQTPAMTLVAIRALIPMLHQVKTMTDSLHRTATCLAELANGAVNEAFRESADVVAEFERCVHRLTVGSVLPDWAANAGDYTRTTAISHHIETRGIWHSCES